MRERENKVVSEARRNFISPAKLLYATTTQVFNQILDRTFICNQSKRIWEMRKNRCRKKFFPVRSGKDPTSSVNLRDRWWSNGDGKERQKQCVSATGQLVAKSSGGVLLQWENERDRRRERVAGHGVAGFCRCRWSSEREEDRWAALRLFSLQESDRCQWTRVFNP